MENKEKVFQILSALRRKKSARDIEFFASYYLPHLLQFKVPEFHKEIFAMLNEKRLGIAAPRSFAKSTIVQIIRGIQLLLTGDKEDILTISNSGSLAEEWIRRIKIELETNEKIIQDFGLLYKWGPEISVKWTENHITIDNLNGTIKTQMRSKGRGCQIRGFRPTRIFCDDLEDDESVRSSEQRQKLAIWFKGALINTLSNDQQIIVIGTLLHPLALLKEIIEQKEVFSSWKTKKYRALEDGKSIWEEKWSTEALLKRKMEIGTYAFEAEYQNNPLPADTVLFKPEWVKKYEKIPELLHTFMFLDPAASEKEAADESAIVVMGVDKNLDIYEVESVSGRWGLWDLVDNVINIYKKYNPVVFGIEKVAFQGVLKPVILEAAKKRGLSSMQIRPITVGTFSDKQRKEAKDKWTRAFKVNHFFENGKVFLKNQKLIEQLLVFPTGDLDDLVDAMVYCLLIISDFQRMKSVVINNNKTFNSFSVGEARDISSEPFPFVEERAEYDWGTAA